MCKVQSGKIKIWGTKRGVLGIRVGESTKEVQGWFWSSVALLLAAETGQSDLPEGALPSALRVGLTPAPCWEKGPPFHGKAVRLPSKHLVGETLGSGQNHTPIFSVLCTPRAQSPHLNKAQGQIDTRDQGNSPNFPQGFGVNCTIILGMIHNKK